MNSCLYLLFFSLCVLNVAIAKLMQKVPIIANIYCCAPITIPSDIAQKIYTISTGSFIELLNLTIDNAPTIPSESTTFDVIDKIIKVVITVIPDNAVANIFENITSSSWIRLN